MSMLNMPKPMEDHDFRVVRKNLNIISGLILLLAFSDAEINRINFLGIDLSLEGGKLYVGIYSLYLYFFWRYMTKVNVPGEFWNKFFDYYRAMATKRFNQKMYFEKVRKEEVTQFESFLEGDIQIQQLQITSQNRSLLNLQLNWSYNTPEDSKIRTISTSESVNLFYPTILFIWYCLRHDKFGDLLFPIVPVLVNLIFFFFNSDWQGSFYQLILIRCL